MSSGVCGSAPPAEGRLPPSDRTPEAQYVRIGALLAGLPEQQRGALSPDARQAPPSAKSIVGPTGRKRPLRTTPCRRGRPSASPPRSRAPRRACGYLVRLRDGGPVTPAVYAEIERIVRSDPRFAPCGGSTLHNGEVVFRNFTGGDEAAYEQGLRALLDKVPANLQLGRAAYTGECLDGIGAYLRHT
jgi:hypothetical protein